MPALPSTHPATRVLDSPRSIVLNRLPGDFLQKCPLFRRNSSWEVSEPAWIPAVNRGVNDAGREIGAIDAWVFMVRPVDVYLWPLFRRLLPARPTGATSTFNSVAESRCACAISAIEIQPSFG